MAWNIPKWSGSDPFLRHIFHWILPLLHKVLPVTSPSSPVTTTHMVSTKIFMEMIYKSIFPCLICLAPFILISQPVFLTSHPECLAVKDANLIHPFVSFSHKLFPFSQAALIHKSLLWCVKSQYLSFLKSLLKTHLPWEIYKAVSQSMMARLWGQVGIANMSLFFHHS